MDQCSRLCCYTYSEEGGREGQSEGGREERREGQSEGGRKGGRCTRLSTCV